MTTTVSSPRCAHEALVDAAPRVYWLDDPARPDRLPPLTGSTTCDLAVVGGGYLGLWTALLAVERDPGRDVLVIEAGGCGEAASGRNGGFCEASLTHGFGNGMARWPEEIPRLLDLGRDNLDGIEATVRENGIDCDLQRSGSFTVATAPHQVAELAEEAAERARLGAPVELLDAAALRARVDSPTYLGGFHDPDALMLEPARLGWGLREACLTRGARIVEGTPVRGLRDGSSGVVLATDGGEVRPDAWCWLPTPSRRCCAG